MCFCCCQIAHFFNVHLQVLVRAASSLLLGFFGPFCSLILRLISLQCRSLQQRPDRVCWNCDYCRTVSPVSCCFSPSLAASPCALPLLPVPLPFHSHLMSCFAVSSRVVSVLSVSARNDLSRVMSFVCCRSVSSLPLLLPNPICVFGSRCV